MSKVENSKELQENKERDLHFAFFEELHRVHSMYRKAIDGEIDNLIGFDSSVPYEKPQNLRCWIVIFCC